MSWFSKKKKKFSKYEPTREEVDVVLKDLRKQYSDKYKFGDIIDGTNYKFITSNTGQRELAYTYYCVNTDTLQYMGFNINNIIEHMGKKHESDG